jgi:hypothetical protein
VTINGIWIGDLDLLTTCTHHSEVQVLAALSLICNIPRSPQHPLSLSPACYVFNGRSLATASNCGDVSASRAHVGTVRRISHNWTLVNCQLYHHLFLALLQSLTQLPNLNWLTHSATNYFTSLHSTELYSTGLGSSLYSLGTGPTASDSSSIFVMDGCLAIVRITFPWESVYRAVTKQRMFFLAIIALHAIIYKTETRQNIQILYFWILSIVLFLFKTTFQRLDSVSVFR